MAGKVLEVGVRIVPSVDQGRLSATFALIEKALSSASQTELLSPKALTSVERAGQEIKKVQAELARAGADGGKAFEKADLGLQNVAKGATRARDEMGRFSKDATAGLADVAAGGTRVGTTFEKVFKANQVGEFVGRLSGAFAELAAPSIALDTATAKIRTLGAEAAAIAPALREAAIQMSKDLPFSAADLTGSMFDALASGVKGGEADLKRFSETAGKLAVGGGSDLSASTAVLSANLNAYGLSAEHATKVSDTLFNVVNLGVTTIPELSHSLSQVVPTAAAAGVELEGVGAALAVMTSKGIPTAQATTKLNSLLVEIQKPGTEFAKVLKAAGVSLDSLKRDDLPVTLEKINKGLAATGKTATQAFSSSEASAAFNSLTGDIEGFKKTFDDVANTSGSASNAYNQMSMSIQSNTDKMLHKVQAFVIEGMDKVGPAFVTAASTATKLAPIATTLSGLKDFLPIESFKKFGASILDSLMPGLLKLGVVRATSVATTVAETGAEIANTGAKLAQAGATGTATVAQYGLNAAFLASPVGIVLMIGAAVGAAAALGAFSDGVKDLDDAIADSAASREQFTKSMEEVGALRSQASELRLLKSEHDSLANSTDPEKQKRFAQVTDELAARVPIAATAIDKLDASGAKIGVTYKIAGDEILKAAGNMDSLAAQQQADTLGNLDDQAQALVASFRKSTEEQKTLREEKERLLAKEKEVGEETFKLLNSDELTGSPFDSMADDLTDVKQELSEMAILQGKGDEEARKLLQTYVDQGHSLEEIKKRTTATVDEITRWLPPLDQSNAQVKRLRGEILNAKAGVNSVGQEIAKWPQLFQSSFKTLQQGIQQSLISVGNAIGTLEKKAGDVGTKVDVNTRPAEQKIQKVEARIVQFGDRAIQAQKSTEAILNGIQLKASEAGVASVTAEYLEKSRLLRQGTQDKIDAIAKELKAARDGLQAGQKLRIEGEDEFRKAVKEQGAAEISAARAEFVAKYASALFAADDETAQQAIANLQNLESLITATSIEAINERGTLRRQILETQQEQDLQAYLQKNTDFGEKAAAILSEELAKISATGTEEEIKAQEVAAFEIATARTNALLATYKASDPEVRTFLLRQANALSAVERQTRQETETFIRQADERRIARIADTAERERETVILEARRTMEERLALIAEEQEAINLAEASGAIDPAEAARQRQEQLDATSAAQGTFRRSEGAAWQKYYDDSNQDVRDAVETQKTFWKDLFGTISDEREKDLLSQRDALDQQNEDLITALQNDELSLEQFFTKRGDMSRQAAEIDKQLQDDNLNFWDRNGRLARAAGAAFGRIKEQQQEKLGTALDDLNKDISAELKNLAAKGEFNFEAIAKSAEEVGARSASTITAVWGQMAASGRATLGDFADAAILTTIQTVRSVVEGNIIGIISAAFAINPFLGVGSIIGIAVIEGLLAKWEADVQARLGAHGFAGGGLVTGPKQLAWLNDDPEELPEFVMKGTVTQKYVREFDLINRGVDPFTVFGNDEPPAYAIAINGMLAKTTAGMLALDRALSIHDVRITDIEREREQLDLSFIKESDASMREVFIRNEMQMQDLQQIEAATREGNLTLKDIREELKELKELKEYLRLGWREQEATKLATIETNKRIGKGEAGESLLSETKKTREEILSRSRRRSSWD